MAVIPYVFKDAGLTMPFDDASDTLGAQAVNGSSDSSVFYIGTTTAGNKLQDSASPGTADITISISDSDGAANVEVADIKLSATSDFSGSPAGGALQIATEIFYGAPAAVYYQWTNNSGAGTYTDISLDVSAMIEVAQ